MGVDALIGLQWGDEGKGKVVDALAGSVDLVVRAQGGANAGHTVKVGDDRRVLHLLPSGMLYERVTGVIGNGVVVDPLQLVKEIDELEAAGHDLTGRLRLSDRAHLVLPWHRVMDGLEERLRGGAALGTTRRGIGPAYQDKAARSGIRAGALASEGRFLEVLEAGLGRARTLLPDSEQAQLEEELDRDRLLQARTRLAPLVADTVSLLHAACDAGREVLLEGAQGTLLDVDLGTYPFVTSSSCHVGGLLSGSGMAPRSLRKVTAVAKAYCTRVGAGPFPTEMQGEVAERIRDRGGEYGATTGRPRRCGWFDGVAARFAVRVNGVDEIALTKTDVLSGQEVLKVCTGYRMGDQETGDFPAGEALDRCEPIYEELPGFEADLGSARTYDDLPAVVQGLVSFIEQFTGARVSLVSTGPEREETIRRWT